MEIEAIKTYRWVYVCTECGGENVEIKTWQNPNNNESDGGGDINDPNDCWCNDCQDHISLEHKKNKV